MHACLDDLVIALYVTIDKLLGPRLGPGRPPKLSDAELVCLAVAQILLGARSERHWLRFARERLGHLFPDLPGQAGYNKRLRAAGHHLCLAIRHLAMRSPSWGEGMGLLDATALPCGQSRETVKRSALLGEREVAQVLLEDTARQQALATGTIILADKGLAGAEFEGHVAGLGAWLVRPDRKDEPRRFGSLGGMRQWIESVINTSRTSSGWNSTVAAPWAGCCPRRSAAAGPGRGGLVQLAARRLSQAVPAGL